MVIIVLMDVFIGILETWIIMEDNIVATIIVIMQILLKRNASSAVAERLFHF